MTKYNGTFRELQIWRLQLNTDLRGRGEVVLDCSTRLGDEHRSQLVAVKRDGQHERAAGKAERDSCRGVCSLLLRASYAPVGEDLEVAFCEQELVGLRRISSVSV